MINAGFVSCRLWFGLRMTHKSARYNTKRKVHIFDADPVYRIKHTTSLLALGVVCRALAVVC